MTNTRRVVRRLKPRFVLHFVASQCCLHASMRRCPYVCVTLCFYSRDTRLILARLRFESKGGRLPGSGGETLAPPFSPIAPSSGKKRALPSWGAGITVGGALTKRATPPKAAPSSTPVGLFKPSYVPTPSPKGVKEDRFAVAGECRRSEPWTAEVVLRKIQQAGSSGASFKVHNDRARMRRA